MYVQYVEERNGCVKHITKCCCNTYAYHPSFYIKICSDEGELCFRPYHTLKHILHDQSGTLGMHVETTTLQSVCSCCVPLHLGASDVGFVGFLRPFPKSKLSSCNFGNWSFQVPRYNGMTTQTSEVQYSGTQHSLQKNATNKE